jgi:hypothetical protein
MVLQGPAIGVAGCISSSVSSKGSPMSEPISTATGKAGGPKKPVSPVRNIIGLVVLIGLLVVVWFEYSSYFGYRAAVSGLNKRMEDEDHGLMPLPEAEKLIAKAPDDAGTDVHDGPATYLKKDYTWKGIINTYTLSAYYTKEKEPKLHHIGDIEREATAPGPVDKTGRSRTPKQDPAADVAKPKPDLKKADDKKPDLKKADDNKPDDNKPDLKKADDKKPDDNKPDDKDSKTPAKES